MADKIVVMNGGNVEQIGAPLELYDRPANLFVAGFIGSPAMNMMRGRISGNAFRAEDGTQWPLPTPNGHAPAEGEAVYGIRPEHLRLDPEGLRATVQVVEPTGSETQVLLRVGDSTLIGAFRERVSARPGDTLPISPEPRLAHLFDGSTGNRI
jgi:multiple sugar transport system ATP-binding protein